MGLNIIDVLFSILDIRGHIPGEYRRIASDSAPAAVGKQVLVATAFVTALALFVLPLAAMVWLAIRLI